MAGRIDAFIPYYDYDTVLAHVLKNHTDILTAYNGIDAARYNLKLAQITPYPDISLQVAVQKDFVVPPQQTSPSVQVGAPIPIWDQNKGAIIAAEAALVRAGEEPHRVETVLTTNLATAYAGYKNNIDALEYYRKYILPDLVVTVRGVEERRRFDPALQFTDLVQAQQNLSTSVTSYVAILGQLWTSTISVADLLQTDDLFQLAQPRELPPLPDLEQLPPLPCSHPCGSAAGAACARPPSPRRGRSRRPPRRGRRPRRSLSPKPNCFPRSRRPSHPQSSRPRRSSRPRGRMRRPRRPPSHPRPRPATRCWSRRPFCTERPRRCRDRENPVALT